MNLHQISDARNLRKFLVPDSQAGVTLLFQKIISEELFISEYEYCLQQARRVLHT